MSDVVWFTEPDAEDHAIVGGKAANLGALARAGFEVPSGFTVSTAAYQRFLDSTGLRESIRAHLAETRFDDPAAVEESASRIRRLVLETVFPDELAVALGDAYRSLGESHVAVRSSGMAEDLADASFAGLHDSYLDVLGHEALCDSVRRCWSSLWATRAVSYRQAKGFDHFEFPIAVVVQVMVASEVSGVVFTGNPMNTATDEVVINASWGLGEAVVQGIVTPDQFVIQHGLTPPLELVFARKDLGQIVQRTIGTKTVEILRDPTTGNGTVSRSIEGTRASAPTLSDEQALELARIARRIEAFHDGFPQDIEFGMADGVFYILQSRPITGVEFSWDAEVNASVVAGEEPDWVWSRRWADEAWTGPVTPLMYSWRAYTWHHGHKRAMQAIGMEELDYTQLRMWKFYKGRVYFNAQLEKALYEKTMPPRFRQAAVPNLPPAWRDDVVRSPFSWLRYIQMYTRAQVARPKHGYNWTRHMADFIAENEETFNGLSVDEVATLPDSELVRYVDHMVFIEHRWYQYSWVGLLFIMRDVQLLLMTLLNEWYDGPNPSAFTDLLMGTDERTFTTLENERLWQLAHRIRTSPALREQFDNHRDGAFFAALEDSPEGREFLADYRDFLAKFGHRGAAEREMAYPRRVEDPALDYRTLTMLLSGEEQVEPEVNEHAVNERRHAAYEEVVANIRRKPLGALKAEAFKLLYRYVHRILIARDNERGFTDRPTLAVKRGFAEMNRRLRARGVFDNDWDYNFLTRTELYRVIDTGTVTELDRAKIAARQRDFERNDLKLTAPALFLQHGRPVDLESSEQLGDGVFRGMPTSSGTVTGRARVIRTLEELGKVEQGDILVTYSTDPGWTPVFLVLKGIVLETGSLLAHGATLAREYGIPAVQIDHAMSLIPDGAQITVDGNTGTVTVEAADPTPVASSVD